MRNILDITSVIDTGSPSREYLIPWISEKLNIHDNYIILNDNIDIEHAPYRYIDKFKTVILDISHNPMTNVELLPVLNNKDLYVLNCDASKPYYTSYFHLKYSAKEYKQYDNEIIYPVSSLNSVPKIHRIMFMNNLYKLGIQSKVYHSFLYKSQPHSVDHLESDTFKHEVNKWRQEYNYFFNNVRHHCPIYADDRYLDVYTNDHSIDSPAYNQTALNIVTESDYNINFFSEKTWKPIYAQQLFIHIGAQNNIKYLRKFGFDVFDDLIDHSYDTEPDLSRRVALAMAEVSRLLPDIIDIHQATAARRRANLAHLTSEKFKKMVEICVER